MRWGKKWKVSVRIPEINKVRLLARISSIIKLCKSALGWIRNQKAVISNFEVAYPPQTIGI